MSLGDSYSAGEGLGDYQPGSSVHQSQCRVSVFGACVYHKDPKVIVGCDRSGHAYNSTVSIEYTFGGGKQTWACSGSITKDIYDPGNPTCSAGHASGHYGEGCQANRVNANTSLITMSIGGNDAGFADDLKSCYENRAKLHWSQACSYEAPTINTKIAGIEPNLIADLSALHERAPHARIILITYPEAVRDPPMGNEGCITIAHICLTPADQSFFNQEAVKLDDAICADAQAAGVGAECINASRRVRRLRDRPEQSMRTGTQLTHQRLDRPRDQPRRLPSHRPWSADPRPADRPGDPEPPPGTGPP